MVWEVKVRKAFSAVVLVAGALGMAAPAFAGQDMSAHPVSAPMEAAGGHLDGHGQHHGDHRRHRSFLLPFGYFEPAPVAAPIYAEAPSVDVAPPEVTPRARDLPPCRETSGGVIVLRGTGCAREKP